jgi:hypothetical protein
MLKVYVAQNPMEAHLVLGLLEAEGIPGEVRGDALFSTLQGGAAAAGLLPAVWIQRDQQAPAALARVARFTAGARSGAGETLPPIPSATPYPRFTAGARSGAGEGEPWHCGACGEDHEGQFTHCWRCGADRG